MILSSTTSLKQEPSLARFIRAILIVSISMLSSACSRQTSSISSDSRKSTVTTLIVSNSEDYDRAEETVSLALDQLTGQNSKHFHLLAVYEGAKEIASQIVDANGDGNKATLIFNTQLSAKSSKTFQVKYLPAATTVEFPKRSHAEISVKHGESYISVNSKTQTAEHKIGDGIYRYEGPGWESDKIAYRLYYDERNVNDIFGKRISDIILPEVGQPGGNYHELAPWGMDILKVGDSLGIGGVGMLVDNKVHRIDNSQSSAVSINADGILQSQLQLNHQQWKIAEQSFDIESTLTINAGSRLTHNKIKINSFTKAPANNIVTGIVKHAPAELIYSNKTDPPDSSKWAYIATFGKQSVVEDGLGMAIFYRTNSIIELSEDEHSYLVILKPNNGLVDYYFSGTWQQDIDGFSNKGEFLSDLNRTLKQLNTPLQMLVNNQ